MSHQIEAVDSQRRAVAQNGGELLGGAGRLVVAGGEAEIVLLLQVAEPPQVVEEQIDRRGVFAPFLAAGGKLAGNFGHDFRRAADARDLHRLRRHRRQAVPKADLRRIGTDAVEDVEAAVRSPLPLGEG